MHMCCIAGIYSDSTLEVYTLFCPSLSLSHSNECQCEREREYPSAPSTSESMYMDVYTRHGRSQSKLPDLMGPDVQLYSVTGM